jgi:hypothetical protein
MKFKIILLIFTILFHNCVNIAKKTRIASSRLHKSHNHKTLSANQARRATADVLSTIAAVFKNPQETLIRYVLGALSAYDDNFQIIYDKYEIIKRAVDKCQDDIKAAKQDEVTKTWAGTSDNAKGFRAKLADNRTLDDKKKYCELCQDTTKEWKAKFSSNKNGENWMGTAIGSTFSALTTKAHTCGYVLDQLNDVDYGAFHVDKPMKQLLYKEFTTKENWKVECDYIMSLDCDNYNPNYAGVSDLGTNVYKYWKQIGAGFTCMTSDTTKAAIRALPGGNDIVNKVFGNAMINGVKAIFGGVAGAAINVLTLGVWGLLKGGYYLVKVGKLLFEIAKNPEAKLKAYLAGKITGNLIIMLKSIVGGRKKHRKLQ